MMSWALLKTFRFVFIVVTVPDNHLIINLDLTIWRFEDLRPVSSAIIISSSGLFQNLKPRTSTATRFR